MKRIVLKSGEWVFSCCHVKPGQGVHRHLIVEEMDRDFSNNHLPHDFDVKKAKWVMMCLPCTQSGDAVRGVPYHLWQVTREIRMDLTKPPAAIQRRTVN
jgi:hypothetical protein